MTDMDDRKREALARAILSTVADDPAVFGKILKTMVAQKEILESQTQQKFDPKVSILLDRLNDIFEKGINDE